MLFQTRSFRSLAKLFFAVPAGEVLAAHELKALCELSVQSPTDYCINYGKQKTLGKGFPSLRFDEVDYLEVSDSSGDLLMTISKRPSTGISQASLFQLMAFGGTSEHLRVEVGLMEHVAARLDLLYGYARTLRSDFDPSTETKRRRGLLSVAVRMEAAGTWLFPSSEIVRGGVKGIYPVNYWKSEAAARLAELGIELPAPLPKLPGVVEFSDADAEHLFERNTRCRSFIRFDGLGS